MRNDKIIIVDENDNIIGLGQKTEVHLTGKLHRAFSTIVINNRGEMLLQKRADCKYHSGGLWTNSFCSHFLENETVEEAFERAGKNELGTNFSRYKFLGKFKYKVRIGTLYEHEVDYVYLIRYAGEKIEVNTEEVSEIKWYDFNECIREVKENPRKFTEWFRLIMFNKDFIKKMKTELENLKGGEVYES